MKTVDIIPRMLRARAQMERARKEGKPMVLAGYTRLFGWYTGLLRSEMSKAKDPAAMAVISALRTAKYYLT